MKMRNYALSLSIALVGAMALTTSCKKDDDDNASPAPSNPTPSLYSQVGGTTMVNDPAHPGMMIEKGYLSIRSVVDSSLLVIAADTSLQPFFAVLLGEVGSGNTTGFTILSKNVTDFFVVNAGGTHFTYGGLNMHDTHNPATNPRMTGLATNASMNAFIADVVVGAHQNSVPDNIIAQFGTLMESLRSTIVQG